MSDLLREHGDAGHSVTDTLGFLCGELALMNKRLGAIADELAGSSIIATKTWLLSAADPFKTFKIERGDVAEYHSVKVDNYTGLELDIKFDGNQPTQANPDDRVPPGVGRIITRPYSVVSIGIDPSVAPATPVPVQVTFYARAQPSATYRLDLGGAVPLDHPNKKGKLFNAAAIGAGATLFADLSTAGYQRLQLLARMTAAGAASLAALFVQPYEDDNSTVFINVGQPAADAPAVSFGSGIANEIRTYNLNGLERVHVGISSADAGAQTVTIAYFLQK